MRETYILAGESTSLRQLFGLWAAKPGGFRIRLFVPFWLAALMFVLTEPMQSGLGLPAFISRETVWGNKGSLNFSSAKPQHELGWAHLPAREIWSSIFDEERKLLSARKKQDLVSRLEPVEVNG